MVTLRVDIETEEGTLLGTAVPPEEAAKKIWPWELESVELAASTRLSQESDKSPSDVE